MHCHTELQTNMQWCTRADKRTLSPCSTVCICLAPICSLRCFSWMQFTGVRWDSARWYLCLKKNSHWMMMGLLTFPPCTYLNGMFSFSYGKRNISSPFWIKPRGGSYCNYAVCSLCISVFKAPLCKIPTSPPNETVFLSHTRTNTQSLQCNLPLNCIIFPTETHKETSHFHSHKYTYYPWYTS